MTSSAMTTTTSTSRRSSSDDLTFPATGGEFVIRCTTVSDGDFHLTEVAPAELEVRRRGLVDLPWTMLHQEHGDGVVRIRRPGEHDRTVADAAVTDLGDVVIGTWVGDCAPVVMLGSGIGLGAAHAGWRGLAAGVLDATADAMREPVATVVLGPTIGPCCYEFGEDDLASVALGVGTDAEAISASTRDGRLALDVPATVAAFAARIGARLVRAGGCTGCTYPGFSHRVRRDRERHVVAAWRRTVAA